MDPKEGPPHPARQREQAVQQQAVSSVLENAENLEGFTQVTVSPGIRTCGLAGAAARKTLTTENTNDV